MKLKKKIFVTICVLFLINLLMFLNPFSIAATSNNPGVISSETAILIDGTTGEVLFEKNSHKPMYPASITKILTAIIAIEEGDLSDNVLVSKKARDVDGTRVYLEPGEQVPLKKLVQGLLINSGNDAGVAIAEHMAGSVESFSNEMNRFTKEKIGVDNSTFKNPHGLFDINHQTTAYDMAMITKYAMKNKEFREIFRTKELRWVGEGWDTTLYNHHKMLWRYEGVNGGKNGYVDQSGTTLVTTAKREETELIAVTLKANSSEAAYSDTTSLLDYGFTHFLTQKFSKDDLTTIQSAEGYNIDKNLFFTAGVNIPIISEVNKNGLLVIKDQNEKVLLEYSLTKELKKTKKSEEVKKFKFSPLVIITYLLVALYIVFLLIMIYLIRLRSIKSRRQKYSSSNITIR
jgi:serine-type D-Ala-D-Ala carboxypeptidase (penicillin-binding protein 5/6)